MNGMKYTLEYVLYDKYNTWGYGGILIGSHKDNRFWGAVKVGERGQIVIPKGVRDKFDIKPGDTLVVFGKDKNQKLIIVKENVMSDLTLRILEGIDSRD